MQADAGKSDGKAEKDSGAPASDGKMPTEKAKPDLSKPDGQPEKGQGVPSPEGKMQADAGKTDGKAEKDSGAPALGGKMPLDKANPPPRGPALTPRPQILPVPRVVIDAATALDDGKSQDIEFSLRMPDGVKLEHLYLDGGEISVAPSGAFKRRLPMGPHTLHIEYGSPSNNLHGQVTQELMVDAEQVQVITPKTRIKPPVKVPGSDQPESAPTKPKDEAAENFDKKTA